MKRTFIYTDEKSNKFWTIEITGNSYTVNYGKTGTAGQTQTKDFADEAACQKAADKLIAEKTKKGYVEQGADSASPSVTAEAKASAPKKSKPKKELPPFNDREKSHVKAFFRAVKSGNIDLIEQYLESGASLTQCYIRGKGGDVLDAFESIIEDNNPDVDTLKYMFSKITDAEDKRYPYLFSGMYFHTCSAPPVKTMETLLEAGYDLHRVPAFLEHMPLINLPDEMLYKLYFQCSRKRDNGKVLFQNLGYSFRHPLGKYVSPRLLWMLDNGLNPNIGEGIDDFDRNAYGTPLHYAIRTYGEYLPLIQKLVEKGADLLAKNAEGLTPLAFAETGTEDVSPEVLDLLRKATADAREKAGLPQSKADPRNAALANLCRLRAHGYYEQKDVIEKARKLLDEGADPNAPDDDGLVPLMHIILNSRYDELYQLLVDAGANPLVFDSENRSPLFFIRRYREDEYAEMIVDMGIDAAHKDNNGDNALAFATKNISTERDINSNDDYHEAVMTLLKVNVPPVDINTEGDSILHIYHRHDVYKSDAKEIIALAVKKGADIDVRNKKGRTPLHAALTRPNVEIGFMGDETLRLFLEAKADPSLQDADGNTALHLATEKRQVSEILKYQPDVTLVNKAGVSAYAHLESKSFYDDKEIKKLAAELLAQQSSGTASELPPMVWKPAPIDVNRKPSGKLEITSSFVFNNNDGGMYISYLGGNLLAVAGNIPSSIDVFDVSKGEIVWQVKGVKHEWTTLAFPLYDDTAVYIPRETGAARYLSAHNRDTGEQLWHCSLSNSDSQFCTNLVQTDSFLAHVNATDKIYLTDKKTGKLTRINLVNPLQDKTLLMWNGYIVVFAYNKKTKKNLIDLYNAAGHVKTLMGVDEEIYSFLISGNYLYLLTEEAVLHKIDLLTGALAQTVPPPVTGEYRFARKTYLLERDGKLYYTICDYDDRYQTLQVYDIASGVIESTCNLPKEEADNLPNYAAEHIADAGFCYYIGRKEIACFDTQKQTIARLHQPAYKGDIWLHQHIIIGGAIYVLQADTLDYGEDAVILHRIE